MLGNCVVGGMWKGWGKAVPWRRLKRLNKQPVSADGLSKRHHRYFNEFKMLPGKWNTNDGKGKQQAKDHMNQCGVQPAAQQPYNIKDDGEATCVV